MFIYLLIYLIVFLCVYFYDIRNYQVGKSFFFWVLLSIFIALAGLRFRVGTDSIVYEYWYDSYPVLSEVNFSEYVYQPLWILYCSFWRSFSSSFILLQLSNAVIINSVIFVFLWRKASYFFSAILIYYLLAYCFFNFEFMREALAIAIFIGWGIKYLQERKWIRYFTVVFICYNIHLSALSLLIYPFVYWIKLKKYSIFYLIFAIIIFSFWFYEFSNYVGTFLEEESTISWKFMYYFSSAKELSFKFYLVRWYLPLIILGIITYSAYHDSVKVDSSLPINMVYYWIIWTMLSVFSDVFGRLGNYIFIFTVVYLSDFAVNTQKIVKRKHGLWFCLILLFISLSSIAVLFSKTGNTQIRFYKKWYPYHSIFNQKVDEVRESLVFPEDERFYKDLKK